MVVIKIWTVGHEIMAKKAGWKILLVAISLCLSLMQGKKRSPKTLGGRDLGTNMVFIGILFLGNSNQA